MKSKITTKEFINNYMWSLALMNGFMIVMELIRGKGTIDIDSYMSIFPIILIISVLPTILRINSLKRKANQKSQ